MEQESEIVCSLTGAEPDFFKSCEKFEIDFETALENDRKALLKKNNNNNAETKEIKLYPFWNYWNEKQYANAEKVEILALDKRIIYYLYLFAFSFTLIVGVSELILLDVLSQLTIALNVVGFLGSTIFLLLIFRYKRSTKPILILTKKGIEYDNELYIWAVHNFIYSKSSKGSFLIIKKPGHKELTIKMDDLQYYPKRILSLIYNFRKTKHDKG